MGAAAVGRKLLAGGSVSCARFADLVATALPTFSAGEVRAVAEAVAAGHGDHAELVAGQMVHVAVGIIADIAAAATDEADVAPAFRARGCVLADVPSRLFAAAGLQVTGRTPTVVRVRPATELGVTTSAELLAALQKRGPRGTLLPVIYAEYEGACEDVHQLVLDKRVFIHGDRIWHVRSGRAHR